MYKVEKFEGKVPAEQDFMGHHKLPAEAGELKADLPEPGQEEEIQDQEMPKKKTGKNKQNPDKG